MKKAFKNILSFILTVLIITTSFFTISCSCSSEDKKDTVINNTSDPDKSEILNDSNIYLFKNGVSNYKIVVPELEKNDKYIKESVEELNYFLSLSCGATLPVVSDNGLTFNENSEYISLGNTSLFYQSNIQIKDISYVDGFEINSLNKSVFINGGGTSGVMFGTYKFLYYEIGFEIFSDDEIFYRKNNTVKLYDFDVRKIPDFDVRHAYVAEYCRNSTGIKNAHRLGLHAYDDYNLNVGTDENGVGGQANHTSVFLADPNIYMGEHPNWYSSSEIPENLGEGLQLCYTSDVPGLLKVVTDNLKKEIVKQPYAKIVQVTHSDGQGWCNCASCTACKSKYGSDSASQLLFINEVAKELNRWLAAPSEDIKGSYTDAYKDRFGVAGDRNRKIYVMMFAYVATASAPVFSTFKDNNIILEDNIAVQWAPISADANYPMNHEKNKSFRNTIEMWAQGVKNIMYWGYSLHEYICFCPTKTILATQENYRFMKSLGTMGIFQESLSGYFNAPDWEQLKAYVQAKLMWNVNANVPELIDNFMEHYFGPVAETMKKIFYDEQDWETYCADVLNRTGYGGNQAMANAEYWPQPLLLNFIDRCDNAQNELEDLYKTDYMKAQRISDRIYTESTPFRYLLMLNYKPLYTENVFAEMKEKFVNDVNRTGTRGVNDNSGLKALFDRL